MTDFTSTEGFLCPPRDDESDSELGESDDSLFPIFFDASFAATGAFPIFLLKTWLLSESEVESEELVDERVWLECFSLALILTSFFLTDFAFCEAESLDSSSDSEPEPEELESECSDGTGFFAASISLIWVFKSESESELEDDDDDDDEEDEDDLFANFSLLFELDFGLVAFVGFADSWDLELEVDSLDSLESEDESESELEEDVSFCFIDFQI